MVGKVILIYDDEHAESFAGNIEINRPAYLCLPYHDAIQCMYDVENGLRFDLFITDLAIEGYRGHRPQICGDDLGRKVRELYPSVPIITVSIIDEPSFANRHLRKPVTQEELLSTIDSLL